MKHISRFLLCALSLVCANTAIAAPVATTVGSNLTAYNPTSGATNNAMWNAYMNPRANTSAPTADFGNCNAAIIRCAQPKCANGGCATMDVARPIVVGCVETNPSCKQYGDDLIDYIAAQLVSDANAASAAAANATATAAQAAAAQSNQQLQQMQQQMQQMQQQMAQQSADTAAQIQAALEQQQAATTAAIASATASTQSTTTTTTSTATGTTTSSDTTASLSAGPIDLTAAQTLAAQSGVDANLLAREQISGEILTDVENAEVALKSAKAAMETAFEYAGCDSTGSNCAGPERVKVFKQKAMEFFDPYNDVLTELYDALILAQSVGVDITDIYMMLSGTCNVWGQYLCTKDQVMHYNSINCVNGKSVPVTTGGGTVFGGASCEPGQVVPMSDGGCQLIKTLTSDADVQRNWLYPEEGLDDAQVRVGCASEILDNSPLFRNMRRQADIDIETLQRIIEQDAPSTYGMGGSTLSSRRTPENDGLPYCKLNDETYRDLQQIAALKELPDKVCVSEREMRRIAENGSSITESSNESAAAYYEQCRAMSGNEYAKCLCNARKGGWQMWNTTTNECECYFNDQSFDWNRLECVSDSENTANTIDKRIEPLTLYDTSSYNPLANALGGAEKIEKLNTSFQNADSSNRLNACMTYGGKWDIATYTCDCKKSKNFIECLRLAT